MHHNVNVAAVSQGSGANLFLSKLLYRLAFMFFLLTELGLKYRKTAMVSLVFICSMAGLRAGGPPVITVFSPISGSTGSSVTITGSNFNATPENNIVFFGATRATVTAGSSTSLTVTVPDGATYQNISVTDITTGLSGYSAQPFITTFSGSSVFNPFSFNDHLDFDIQNYLPVSIGISDLDGDGKPDLITANTSSGNVSVLRNTSTNGVVAFTAAADYTTGTLPSWVNISDLDGDGKPDVIVLNRDSRTVSVLRNISISGTISFAPKIDFSTGTDPYGVSVGDLDGDGRPDLVVAAAGENSVSVLRNTSTAGTISFDAKVNFSTGGYTQGSAIADLDGDGKPEIVAANYGGNTIAVLKNTSSSGTISFENKIDLVADVYSLNVAISDLDGDGKPDIAVANTVDNTILVFGNTSSGGTLSFANKATLATGSAPEKMAIGDLDGDGRPDLAVANSGSNTISVIKNTSTSGSFSFASKVDYKTGGGPYGLVIGDLNGDGKPDLTATNYYSASISVLKNIVTLTPVVTSITPTSATSGETVTITGDHFTGANMVSFGGTAAYSFSVVSPTNITAVVGAGTSGSVSVSTPGGGTGTGSAFTFTAPPPPTITSFAPLSAISGATINITGTNLIGTTDVSIGGTPALSFTVVSSVSIKAVVGNGASGSISVTTPGGTATQEGFTFILPPVVTSFSPTSGPTGTTVTITGTDFNTTPANNIVFFGAVRATVTAATSTSLTVTSPVVVTHQNISVTDITSGLSGYSTQPFITTFAGSNGFDAYSFAPQTKYETGNSARNMCLSDVDGDGKPDMVTANSGYGNFSVIRNTSTSGTLSFEPKVDYTTSDQPGGLAVSDLNGDGRPDIVLTISQENKIAVFMNTSSSGKVSFDPAIDFETGADPSGVAVADFDGDGKPDLAVANYGSSTVSVLKNTSVNGIISFANKSDLTAGSSPLGILAGDMNGDGKPEIAVVNLNSSTVSVFRNTSTSGTISFASKLDRTTGAWPESISLGDLDGDGKPDMTIANSDDNTISVIRNTSSAGTLSFGPKVDYATGLAPQCLSVSDLDGDGLPDIAVANNTSGSVSVLKNRSTIGAVSFDAKVDYITSEGPSSIAAGDLDGDGKPDLAAPTPTNNRVSVFRNTVVTAPVITSFSPENATSGETITIIGDNFTGTNAVYFGGTAAHSFTVVSPTKIEALVGAGVSGNISVTKQGGGTASKTGFTYIAPPAPTITSVDPSTAAAGARVTITGTNLIGATAISFGGTSAELFNANSATSITAAVGTGASGDVSVTSAGGTATFAGFTFLPSPTITSFSPVSGPVGSTVTITGTDFNTTPANNIVFFGATKATVTAATSTSLSVTVPYGTTYQYIAVTDISKGLTAYTAQPFITTFDGSTAFGPSSFAPQTELFAGSGVYKIAAADLDNDGKPDLSVVNKEDNTLAVFRNDNGSISAENRLEFPLGTAPCGIAAGDVDGDGKKDLVVTNFGSNTISVLRNTSTTGTISFAVPVDYPTANGPMNLSLADVNGDGRPDIVVINYSDNTVSVFRNTGTTGIISFAAKVDFATGRTPSGLSVGDLDGDGKPDIAVVNMDDNNASVLRNTSTAGIISFAAKTDFTTGQWPESIAIGDLDGNGKADFAVTNHYSNTVSILQNTSTAGTLSFAAKVDYQTGMYPGDVSLGDLDGDGKPDLAISNVNSSTVSVLKNNSTSGTLSFSSKNDYDIGMSSYGVAISDLDSDGKPELITANSANNTISILKNKVTPVPVVTSVTPASATSGETVTIEGSYFTGAQNVKFGGTAAHSFTVVSSTKITAVIGAGVSGDVNVTTEGGTGSLPGFTYTIPPAPAFTSFSPATAATGAIITISGTNLIGTTAVTFGGKPAESFTIVSATTIKASVGAGASGNVSITTPGGTAVMEGFTFIPAPVVISFSPMSGPVGTTVIITGSNFNTSMANNVVFFGAARATVTAATSTSLTVTVPNGATYQNISVSDITTGLTACTSQPFVTTFPGNHTFDANSFAAKKDYTTGNYPKAVAIGDLDNDGKPDLAVTSAMDNAVNVLQNTSTPGSVSFADKVNAETAKNPEAIAISDLDGDGKPDVIAAVNDNYLSILKNTSTGGTISFASKLDYPTDLYPKSISVGDLDGDGRPDIVVTYSGANKLSIFRNTSGGGVISFLRTDLAGDASYGIALGDLNGDGKPDLIIANIYKGTVSVLKNTSTNGAISFDNKVDFTTGIYPAFVSTGDLDGDGKQDIAVACYGDNTVSVLHNTSSGGSISFAAMVNYATAQSPWGLAIGDMDGDGKPDMVTVNSDVNTLSLLRNTSTNGTIYFADKVDYETGNFPYSLALGDLDGNGTPDVAVANNSDKSISVFRSTVTPAPVITSFDPVSALSGTTVTITGTNFTGATAVSFGGNPAHSFTVVSPTSISAVTGEGTSGNVSVTTPGGTASLSGFTYLLSQTISFNPMNAKIYGSVDFDPGATASSSLPVTYTSSNTAIATIVSNKVHMLKVGSCVIYADQAGNVTYAAAPQVSQTLVVTPKSVTITGVTAANKAYDGTLAATLTGGTLEGIVTPDVVTFTAGAGAFVDVNAGNGKAVTATGYTITGSDAGNYTLAAQPAAITANISQVLLTVTADNKTRKKGEANPAFTMTYSGFVNGETESVLNTSPIAACAANNTSEAGNYPITVSGGNDDNYTFTYISGTLTVTPATGIMDAIAAGYLVYPNPASDYLIIKSPKTGAPVIKIFDMQGHMVMECKAVNERIDLRGLASGVYHVRIDSYNYRLIKQ